MLAKIIFRDFLTTNLKFPVCSIFTEWPPPHWADSVIESPFPSVFDNLKKNLFQGCGHFWSKGGELILKYKIFFFSFFPFDCF